jgi:hypothetical protein
LGNHRLSAPLSRFGEDVRELNRTDDYRIRSTGTRLQAIPLAVPGHASGEPAGSA